MSDERFNHQNMTVEIPETCHFSVKIGSNVVILQGDEQGIRLIKSACEQALAPKMSERRHADVVGPCGTQGYVVYLCGTFFWLTSSLQPVDDKEFFEQYPTAFNLADLLAQGEIPLAFHDYEIAKFLAEGDRIVIAKLRAALAAYRQRQKGSAPWV